MTHPPPDSSAPQTLEARLGRSALLFEADVLERLLAREPGNVAYLAALGQACSKLRAHERGLRVDRQLVAARPQDPTFRYNLACSLALTGDLASAHAELLQAIELGYRDVEHLLRDEDLAALRDTAGFAEVRRRLRELGVAGA